MYKIQKKVMSIFINALVVVFFIVISIALITSTVNHPFILLVAVPLLVFPVLLIGGNAAKNVFDKKIYADIFEKGETQYLTRFINRLKFCYSFDDFYKAIGDILENEADCSVLFLDSEKNYVLYNSPNRLSSSQDVRFTLALNFPAAWPDGIYLIDETLGIVSSHKKARGFFFAANKQHLYVFCRYTRLFDTDIYNQCFEEFKRFQTRSKTIGDLTEISDLTTQWQQLADAQRSFLPQNLPDIPKLKLAAYYKPLINVSGDYYSVLPLNADKTLLLLGDVSGKGLAAALVMGLVVNTVKIIDDKEDLVTMICEIDKAIKNMKLQDKYTVLFLCIIDTKKMTIRYINASMSDPIILSRMADRYRIRPLASNASLVGIIEMGDVHVAEQKLYHGDTILIASDGVSEVMNSEGVELGDTDIFKQTMQASAEKRPEQFIEDMAKLIFRYSEGILHDDVTMMVAKVG